MTIVSCPKCSDEVALPAGASSKATVRCPLCQDEFLLADILDTMPPFLIVVDDPEAVSSPVAAGPAFAPVTSGIDDGELGLAGPEPISVTPSFGIESSVAPATSAKPTAGKRRAAPRPKKKKSAAMEIAKIVLGGIAGLTIAQLILWWNPWKRTDPFELAPKLGATAPWIVPAELRGEANQDADNDKATGKKAPAKPGATPSKQDELPMLTFVDPSKAGLIGEAKKGGRKAKPPRSGGSVATADADTSADDSRVGALPEDPDEMANVVSDGNDLGDDLIPDLSIDSDPLKMLDPLISSSPKDSGTESTEATDPPESAPARFAKARKVTAAELSEALKDAQTIARAWNLSEDADSRELLRQTYRVLAGLGEAITFAAQGSQSDEAEVADLLKSLAGDDKKLENLGKAGGAWWQHSGRDTPGVLLLGVVKSIKQQGDLYETKLALPVGDSVVSMYSDADPAGLYKVDSDVVVLGAIIEDPAANLTGYEGNAESVVWSRISVVVPKS